MLAVVSFVEAADNWQHKNKCKNYCEKNIKICIDCLVTYSFPGKVSSSAKWHHNSIVVTPAKCTMSPLLSHLPSVQCLHCCHTCQVYNVSTVVTPAKCTMSPLLSHLPSVQCLHCCHTCQVFNVSTVVTPAKCTMSPLLSHLPSVQ